MIYQQGQIISCTADQNSPIFVKLSKLELICPRMVIDNNIVLGTGAILDHDYLSPFNSGISAIILSTRVF